MALHTVPGAATLCRLWPIATERHCICDGPEGVTAPQIMPLARDQAHIRILLIIRTKGRKRREVRRGSSHW